ncbi:MAG: PorT family protein [Bacteroidales bacterium]|nr:PorT family protein [Bacteroidales bacterium]
MKRIIVIAAAMLFCLCAKAQLHFGPVVGMTSSTITNIREVTLEDAKPKNATRYHAGVTMQARLPHGFAIQPSLMYHCKDAKVENLTTGYLEMPVGIQWGPDLILFRPYLEVAPMVGVAVNSKIDKEMLNRLEYGVGVGGGLDVWKLQISARYNWDLNQYMKASETAPSGSYRCVTLSLAFLF